MNKEFKPHYAPPTQPAILKIDGKDYAFWIIVSIVLFLHVLFLAFTAISSADKKPPQVKERLLVKTVSLQPRTSSPRDNIAYMPAPPPTPPQPFFTPPPQPAPPPTPPQPAPPPPPSQPEVPTPPTQPAPFIPPEQPYVPPPPPQPAPPSTQVAEVIIPPKRVEKKKPQNKDANPKQVAPTVKAKPKAKTSPPAKKTTDVQPKKATTTAPTQVKKSESKPITEKKEESLPTIDPVAEAKKAKQRELLSKAKESMSKAGQARSNVSNSYTTSPIAHADVPQAIGSLQIDAFSMGEPVLLTTKESSYRDEIAHRLRLGLRLPEYGEVKIKLTLERSGKVSLVQIVSSKNAKNKQYVEKTVPTLTFPSFGDNFDGSQDYTFVICLNNEY